jgi:hypothetical protein
MYGRLTRVGDLKAIEGIASDVRQASIIRISSDNSAADWADSYECLFRLSGAPVALRVKNAIFIENGETVRVVGRHNRDGVFEASAYYNRSTGVSGKSGWARYLQVTGIGMAIVGVGEIPYFRFLFGEQFFRDVGVPFGVFVVIGLALALAGLIMFMRSWGRIREISRLLNGA